MNSYIRSILIITMVCHIFSLLTPSTTGIRKTYRFLCGMVVLAVIALPIRDVVSGIMDAMELRLYVTDIPAWQCRQMETDLAARMEAVIHVWEKNEAEGKTEKQAGSGA